MIRDGDGCSPESQRDIIKLGGRDAELAKTANVHRRYFCFIQEKKKFSLR